MTDQVTADRDSATTATGTAFEDLPSRSVIKHAVAASALGNATEWYDYGVYAVTATYIGTHFFPGEHAALLTLATLAVSFVVRPLGGFFWGPLGDRVGRKRVLSLTILLMAGATFCIGLLPTTDTIGVGAPLLLILLRLIQGFSTGGEYGGAATFMAEYAPDKRRGLYGSFLEFGTLGGMALGTGVVLILQGVLSAGAMDSWGWRLPFFLAGPLGLIGMYLRTRLDETPVFQDLDDAGESQDSAGHGLIDLVRDYWRQILVMAGMVIALNVANYTLLTYMPTYLEHQIGMGSSQSLIVILVGELVMMAVIPFSGYLSDFVGRKKLWWVSTIGLVVFAYPMFRLMGQGFGAAMLAFAILGLLYIPQLSTISATFPAMFPAHVRFTGFAVTYNVFTAIFGGTAAAVNEGIVSSTGFLEFPAVYMMAACLIGAICLAFLKETAGTSLHGTEVPESVPGDFGGDAVREETRALEACGR